MKPPLLDKRSRADVLAEALRLAGVEPPSPTGYTPSWAPDGTADPGYRLIELFSRLAEVLIERLNGVPQRNFLEFLQLAGVERFPGAPAEVPVTFLVSKRATVAGKVPAGTQVATTQTKTAPARVFETRRPFDATLAKLKRVVALHPATDKLVELPVADVPPTADSLAATVPTEALSEDTASLEDVPHALYIASSTLFGRKDVVIVSLTLQFAGPDVPHDVVWYRFDKDTKEWVPITGVSADYAVPTTVMYTFHALSAVDKVIVDGNEDFWVAAVFDGDFTAGASPPTLTQINGSFNPIPATPSATLDAAFYNASPLDTSKPFSPFGPRPVYGDALYLGSTLGFAPDNALVTLSFQIRPYVHDDLRQQFDTLDAAMTVRTLAVWQYLNIAGQWVNLVGGTFDHSFTFAATSGTVTRPTPAAGEGAFIGGSSGSGDTSATVTFSVPADIGLHTLNDVESRWFRVLLKSENPYGHEGVVVVVGGTTPTTRFVGPLLIPPRVEGVSIVYAPNNAFLELISQGKTFNNFAWADVLLPAAPWVSVATHQQAGVTAYGANPALYLAFDRAFEPSAFISLFVDLARPTSSFNFPIESGNPNVAWEYRSTGGWLALDVSDETVELTTSGTVAFNAPLDAAPTVLFAQADAATVPDEVPRWWLRARLVSGAFDHPPAIRGIYLNTVMADNQTTTAELLVGSSNAEPNQTFALTRAPVLGGELWVREQEPPTEGERHELDVAAAGADGEVWVRWTRVPTFELSGPRSRHYLLEAVAGRVAFGGQGKGLIPPLGRDNLVIRGLRTGGGSAPNADTTALAVKEMKTSLPFIDKVFNVQPAAAGASEWSLPQLLEFGPQSLKNHGRSVTTEDYEWMVRQRFSEVARVRCVPTSAPDSDGTLVRRPGHVTVLVVPWSADPRPQPTQGLIRKVREYLAQTSLANIVADIHVIGPDYDAVDITATLVATRPELASSVLRKARAAIEQFLHPLTGGETRTGYGFGRLVFLSEVHAILERIEDVDHVASARFGIGPGLGEEQDVFQVIQNHLASSGTHEINVLGAGAGT